MIIDLPRFIWMLSGRSGPSWKNSSTASEADSSLPHGFAADAAFPLPLPAESPRPGPHHHVFLRSRRSRRYLESLTARTPTARCERGPRRRSASMPFKWFIRQFPADLLQATPPILALLRDLSCGRRFVRGRGVGRRSRAQKRSLSPRQFGNLQTSPPPSA